MKNMKIKRGRNSKCRKDKIRGEIRGEFGLLM